uniref:Uncharacterized protein n=1 Tax=Pararge aegeria TaxID=116150 RepID=S4PTS6_9NEOP
MNTALSYTNVFLLVCQPFSPHLHSNDDHWRDHYSNLTCHVKRAFAVLFKSVSLAIRIVISNTVTCFVLYDKHGRVGL